MLAILRQHIVDEHIQARAGFLAKTRCVWMLFDPLLRISKQSFCFPANTSPCDAIRYLQCNPGKPQCFTRQKVQRTDRTKCTSPPRRHEYSTYFDTLVINDEFLSASESGNESITTARRIRIMRSGTSNTQTLS